MFTFDLTPICVVILLAPLVGSLLAGLWASRKVAHHVTIAGVAIAFVLSLWVAKAIFIDHQPALNTNLYIWGISGNFRFDLGFLIDPLTALMMVTVTFVSLLVHIYSIGYMRDDAGYQRFFSYMSLFTFAMLSLVMANNFLQLFFGWEGVGLVSYLLIGFWFNKESANVGSLKAFIVNRVGDLGFFLGIATILGYFGTLDYMQVFQQAPTMLTTSVQLWSGMNVSLITLICVLLFIGAMGKSAQVPLHVWLPESMEGPTPISALIHAATMVTAGIFMIARLSPLFEYSETALSLVLIIGATGALFTGILALVQTDIKRVVAYSTLSQLGYMTAALGVSAYAAGMFHLVTHAAFKALLFLAAGSVIVSMHHEQDMRKMGGLWRYLPLTYGAFLIGALALSAIPPFSGFYSKDSIIEAIHLSPMFGAQYGYWCCLIGTFVTALYIFRAFFMTFHTTPRMDKHSLEHLHESPWVILVPLIVLSIPSVILGYWLVGPLLFTKPHLLGNSIFVLPNHQVLNQLAQDYTGAGMLWWQAWQHPAFWFALSGILVAAIAYIWRPAVPGWMAQRFSLVYFILVHKYGFDDFNQLVFVRGTKALANTLYRVSDVKIIDDWLINGSARGVGWLSKAARKLQSGLLYQYALIMIIGVLFFMWWLMR